MGSRSTEPITRRDLKRLAAVARREREDFFSLNAAWSLLYAKRLLCVALGGEAAVHALNATSGFAAFELWNFYATHADAPYPSRRKAREDFGPSRFGRDPDLPESFLGRAVDIRGRSIDAEPADNAVTALHRYLHARATPTARELARQSLVLVEPESLLGFEVWPTLIAT